MYRRFAVVFSYAILTFGFLRAAEPVLGAADFKPSPEHPFGWRGDGTGKFTGATPAIDWTDKNIRWRAPVGKSYSSPILTDTSIIVASEPGLLISINRADGKERWRVETKSSDLPDEKQRAAANEYKAHPAGTGMTASTPLTDGKRIYMLFANGIVRCLDLDGKQIWIAYIDAEQNSTYGRSASPILAGGKLIVHMTSLYAFDPATGKQLWVNAEAKSTYGTPFCFQVNGKTALVTPDGDVVNVEDGKSLATRIAGASNTSPVVDAGVIYFGEREAKAVKLNAAFKDEEVWSGDIVGDSFGSPVIHNGLVFTVTGIGQMFTFEVAGKGTPVVEARPLLGDAGGGGGGPIAFASFALAGQYLFLNSTIGDLVILEATREAKQVGKITLKEGATSPPIFSGSEMFVRDGDALVCFGAKK